MWCRSCKPLAQTALRLGCSLTLSVLLVLTVIHPPLAYAAPTTPPAPAPRLDPLVLGLILPSPALPLLLAQASGYDAGTATATDLLHQWRTPSQQHLQTIPSYSDAERDRLLGNRYYRQEPATQESADPLRDEAAASTDPTLDLVQDRALRPIWRVDGLVHALSTQRGPDSIPENGCGLFAYCAAQGTVTREETCTVEHSYEEQSCHEYYTHETVCVPRQETGSLGLCVDHFLYAQMVRDDSGRTLLIGLDTGPEGALHKNCGDGPQRCFYQECGDGGSCYTCEYDPNAPGYVGQWHVLATLPPVSTPPVVQLQTAGGGCSASTTTLNALNETVLAGTCSDGGAQGLTVQWSASYDSCTVDQPSSGAEPVCVDGSLQARLARDPTTAEILLQVLDTGFAPGTNHLNCAGVDGAGDVGGWHTLQRLPADAVGVAASLAMSGDGCSGGSPTVLTGIGQSAQMSGGCWPDGAQMPAVTWTLTQSVSNMQHTLHDDCAPYRQSPWFEVSHQCVAPAAVPGLQNECDDMLRTYGNLTEVANTCGPWLEGGCTQTGQTCTAEDCTRAERTFACTEPGCTDYRQAVLCSTCTPDPPRSPRCTSTETPVNTDFGLATAVMEGQVTLGENHDAVPGDPPEIYAFPGFAQACTSNILVNCCNTEAAQEASQQIDTAITAVQMAMNAYKVATAIQNFYVATTAMMQVYGYTMAQSAQLVASQMMSSWAAGMFAISWTGVVMVIVVVVMMVLQMLMQCDEASTETAIKANLDLCVDVGDYCATKLLFGCFKRRHAKCCFPSLFAKIIQVQGRAQLAAMPMTSPPRDPQCLADGRYPDVGWGDPRSPNCRGLTVCELQAIDWERIDWSEYLEQLQRRISQPTRDQVTQQADDLMEATDFLGEAAATIAQYGGLADRVTTSISVPGNQRPSADFSQIVPLHVSVEGSGTVTVSWAGRTDGLACSGGTCALRVPAHQPITAAAIPTPTSALAGWSGACTGTGPCTVTLSRASTLTARFTTTGHALTVAVRGPGTVTSSPAGLTCTTDATCTAGFPAGAGVTLTASPDPAAVFEGWSGACHGSTAPCPLQLTAPQTVVAEFRARPALSSFIPAAPGQVHIGIPMTWTASAAGGTPPLQFQFTRETGGVATVVQDWSPSATYTWIPSAAQAATYRLQVAVRNAGSSGPGDDFAITESFEVVP